MRLAICVPTSGFMRSTPAFALARTCAYFTAWEGTEEITLLMQESSVVHSNREILVGRAMEWDASHVLFIDDDMVWKPDAVLSLISRDLPFVACNYPKREFPIVFTAVDREGNRIVTDKNSTGVQSVSYAGFGLSLIRAEVFKKVTGPYFQPAWSTAMGDYTTEDAPFYYKAREEGFDPVIDHDASKMGLGHVGTHIYGWNQSAEVGEPDGELRDDRRAA